MIQIPKSSRYYNQITMANRNFIRVQNEEFLSLFIQPARRLAPDNPHFCFTDKTVEIFFKLKEFPQQMLTKQITSEKDLTKKVIDGFINRLIADFHRGQSTKYLLSYNQIIISYPYACLFHQPIKSLDSYLAGAPSLVQKFELMLAISRGVQDFHDNNIQMKSLKLTNIVNLTKNSRAGQISIAFTEIGAPADQYHQESTFYERSDVKQPQLTNDIYSLGLIFYEIYFNKKADQSNLQSDQLARLEKSGSWFGKLMNKMVTKVAKDRFRIREVIKILGNARMSYKLLNNN